MTTPTARPVTKERTIKHVAQVLRNLLEEGAIDDNHYNRMVIRLADGNRHLSDDCITMLEDPYHAIHLYGISRRAFLTASLWDNAPSRGTYTMTQISAFRFRDGRPPARANITRPDQGSSRYHILEKNFLLASRQHFRPEEKGPNHDKNWDITLSVSEIYLEDNFPELAQNTRKRPSKAYREAWYRRLMLHWMNTELATSVDLALERAWIRLHYLPPIHEC